MCSISHDYELKLIKTYSEGGLRRFRLCSLKWNTVLENLICRGRIGYIHYYGSFIFFKLNFQADWPSKVKYTEGKQYVFLLKKQTTIVTQRQCLRLLNYLKIKYVQMQMEGRPVGKKNHSHCLHIWQMKIYQNSSSPVVIKVIYECMYVNHKI